MPKFNYKKARFELGMTPEEIVQFLDSEAAEGRTYNIDPAAYPALRIARQLQATSNPQAEAEPPPFYADPIEAAATLAGGGKGAFQAGAHTAEAIAGRLAPGALRRGAKKAAEMAMDAKTGGGTAVARRVLDLFRRGPQGPTNVPMPPGATMVPAPAASALPGGFSAPISTASQGLPEAVGSRIAAGAETVAEEVPKGMQRVGGYLRRLRGQPKPKKSNVVKMPEPVKKRIQAAKQAEKPRHDVQYFSKSKGQYIDIEDMNQKHIEQAYRSLARTNPKPGSVASKVMDALLEESKHRLTTTGIHIGQ